MIKLIFAASEAEYSTTIHCEWRTKKNYFKNDSTYDS